MKTYLLLAALLPSSAANAQTDAAEKVRVFLLIVDANEKDSPGDGKLYLQNTGISDVGAKALVEYARRGVEEANRMGKEHAEALCKD